MDRRDFMQATAGLQTLPLASAGPARAPSPEGRPEQPTVTRVFGDQHRAQAPGCAGDANASTPNLGTLAAQGLNLTAAVSGFPLCCPFRASLVTGRYPHKCVPGREYPLPDGQPTIARAPNDAGYRTAWFGKRHLSGWHKRD